MNKKAEAYFKWLEDKNIKLIDAKRYGHLIARDYKNGAYVILASKGRWSFPTDGIYFETYKEAIAYAKANNPYEAHRQEVAKRKEKEAIELLTSLGYKVAK